eukprot:354857-Chlamydomonas_euryale.AAC.15
MTATAERPCGALNRPQPRRHSPARRASASARQRQKARMRPRRQARRAACRAFSTHAGGTGYCRDALGPDATGACGPTAPFSQPHPGDPPPPATRRPRPAQDSSSS